MKIATHDCDAASDDAEGNTVSVVNMVQIHLKLSEQYEKTGIGK